MKGSIFFLLFLGVVAGCIPCHTPSSPLPVECTDLRGNVEEAFATPSVCCGEELCGSYWEIFQDSDLSYLIEDGLKVNPDIKSAEARIALASEEARVARAVLYPHLFLFGGIKRVRKTKVNPDPPGGLDLYTESTLGLTNLSYELDLWKKNRSLYYSALSEEQAQIADWCQTRLLLASAIAQSYFALKTNLEKIVINQGRLAAREELYSLLDQQFRMGVINEFRLYETNGEVQEIKDLLYLLEEESEINRHALTALVVSPSCGAVSLPQNLGGSLSSPFPLPATLPLDLLSRRPDIVAERWRVESGLHQVQAAKARFFPQIDLAAFVGFRSIKFSELFSGRALDLIGEATGLLLLFTAGQLEAELGIARTTSDLFIESYNQTLLVAIQEVSDALTQLISSDRRKETVTLAIEDAAKLYNLTSQRYEKGIANRITVLNATENLLAQEDLAADIELARLISAVDLIRAIGGGYDVGR